MLRFWTVTGYNGCSSTS